MNLITVEFNSNIINKRKMKREKKKQLQKHTSINGNKWMHVTCVLREDLFQNYINMSTEHSQRWANCFNPCVTSQITNEYMISTFVLFLLFFFVKQIANVSQFLQCVCNMYSIRTDGICFTPLHSCNTRNFRIINVRV